MPTRAQIAATWAPEVGPWLAAPNWCGAEDECMACGRDDAPLERAHVVPRMLGGSREPGNVMLLCSGCHAASPDVADPSVLIEWVIRRESHMARFQRIYGEAVRRGVVVGGVGSVVDRVGWERFWAETVEVLDGSGLHGASTSPGTLEHALIEAGRRLTV